MLNRKYILITAARNEESLIENTINSVLSQTIKPNRWFIVSDNSTDRTDDIVEQYSTKNNFISLIRNKEKQQRNFASKVYALNLALSKIRDLEYDYIGILDADITFNANYYESMINEFENDSKLGLVGGEFFDIINGNKIRVVKSSSSVRGGIQFFRAECFKQLNSFVPLKNGGEDVVAEITVRKNGWITKSFDHQMLEHHRLTGTGGWNIYQAKFNEGILSYTMGYHPIFQILKSLHRFKEQPYFVSGFLHLAGFIFANFKREKRPVSKDFIKYIRNEQINRIKSFNF